MLENYYEQWYCSNNKHRLTYIDADRSRQAFLPANAKNNGLDLSIDKHTRSHGNTEKHTVV